MKTVIYRAVVCSLWLIAQPFQVTASAQIDTLWTRTLGGEAHEEGWAVLVNTASHYVIAGTSGSYGTDAFVDGYLAEMDAQGNLIWQEIFESSGYNTALLSAAQTSDGGYLLAGIRETRPSVDFRLANPTGAYYARTTASGKLLWERVIERDYRNVFQQVLPTADGGYALAGYHEYPRGGSPHAILFKVDEEGTVLFETPLTVGYAQLIDEKPDGRLLTISTDGAGGCSLLVAVVDTQGDVIEQVSHPIPICTAAARTVRGGYVVAGNRWPGSGCSQGGDSGAVVVKLDEDGMPQWEQSFGSVCAYPGTWATSVTELPGGGYVVVGQYKTVLETTNDIFVTKLKEQGDIAWTSLVDRPDDDVVTSIVTTATGDLVAVGRTDKDPRWDYDTNTQILVVTLREDTQTGVTDIPVPASDFVLEPGYPNPFNRLTHIPFSLSKPAHVVLTIHDMMGRTIALLASGRYAPGQYEVLWDPGFVGSGVYVCRLQVDAQASTQMLMVQK